MAEPLPTTVQPPGSSRWSADGRDPAHLASGARRDLARPGDWPRRLDWSKMLDVMLTVAPIYTAENCRAAYQLDWALTVFWQSAVETTDWLDTLKRLWSPTGFAS